jgi:hypothetical protein
MNDRYGEVEQPVSGEHFGSGGRPKERHWNIQPGKLDGRAKAASCISRRHGAIDRRLRGLLQVSGPDGRFVSSGPCRVTIAANVEVGNVGR